MGVGYYGSRVNLPKTKNSDEVKIVGVIDGDTIVTEAKTKIRLRQVDAPEIGNCGGQEAKELLEKLVVEKTVQLRETEFEQSEAHRPMYLVYVGETLVNEELVKSGWGKYHSDKTSVSERLKAAAKVATEEKMGIFGEKCSQTINRENPKCNIKGNIDPNNSQVKIYQMPGCIQYGTTTVDLWRGEQWFCTEKEAIAAGYARSKRCP